MTTAELKYQERLAYCVKHLEVCEDTFGTFAKVPSTSDHNCSYRVDIDESHGVPFAIRCTCTSLKPECIHFQAVNLFYQQIAAIFAKEEPVKEPVIRNDLQAVHMVSYQILDMQSQDYYSVQMENGRGASCIDPLGKKCHHRIQHPAVPCPHMHTANLAEEKHRQQLEAETYVQRYDFPEPVHIAFKQLVQEQLDKCTEAFRAVMRQPIDEIEGTSDWFKAAEKREKEANKARLKQRKISQERINAFIAQQQEAVAA